MAICFATVFSKHSPHFVYRAFFYANKIKNPKIGRAAFIRNTIRAASKQYVYDLNKPVPA